MKIIGTNKELVLSKERVEFWLGHQKNQRGIIPRHVSALAKMLARVGWRNDQRICITENNEIINGLQRLSAIYELGDFGWKIPITVYRSDELTNDIIESFNVQKSDCNKRLMMRLYGWKDRRMCSISHVVWQCLKGDACNATTRDLLDVYELTREKFDLLLTIRDKKVRGSKSVPVEMYVAALACALEGLSIDKFIQSAQRFTNDDASDSVWKSLRDWNAYWGTLKETNGNPLRREPGGILVRVAYRYSLIKEFVCGKKITPIKKLYSQGIQSESINTLCNHLRDIMMSNLNFDDTEVK